MDGIELRKLRKERGLSQEKLAAILHVATTTIYRWESDLVKPGIHSKALLLDILLKSDGLTHPFVTELLNSSDGVALLDNQAVYQRANNAFLRLTNLAKDKLIGAAAQECFEMWKEIAHESGAPIQFLSTGYIASIEFGTREKHGDGLRHLHHEIVILRQKQYSTILVHRVAGAEPNKQAKRLQINKRTFSLPIETEL